MNKHLIEVPALVEEAYNKAKAAQKNSYSPYSRFAVGAALKFKDDDKIYPGTNVENISFGGTCCAERSALFQRITEKGEGKIEFIVVIAHTENPTFPCGLCLQALSEFGKEDFPVYAGNAKRLSHKMNFRELLPFSFDSLKEGQGKNES